MLRYIVEKNGGKIRWNNDLKLATATIGDVTYSFKSDSSNTKKGKMYVDGSLLKDIFGLDDLQARHQSFDRFDSEQDAAVAFVLNYQKEAMSREVQLKEIVEGMDGTLSIQPKGQADPGQEIGAFIYSETGFKNGKIAVQYYFGKAFWGGHDNVIAGLVANGLTSPEKPAAMVHVHPALCTCHKPNEFSPQDKWLGDVFDVSIYVGTPSEGIKKHQPKHAPDIIIYPHE